MFSPSISKLAPASDFSEKASDALPVVLNGHEEKINETLVSNGDKTVDVVAGEAKGEQMEDVVGPVVVEDEISSADPKVVQPAKKEEMPILEVPIPEVQTPKVPTREDTADEVVLDQEKSSLQASEDTPTTIQPPNEDLQKAEEEISRLQQEREQIQKDREDLQAQLQTISRLNSSLQTDSGLLNEARALTSKLETDNELLEEKVQGLLALEEELSHLKSKRDEEQNQHQEAKDEAEKQRQELSNLRDELEKEKIKLSEAKMEGDKMIKDLEARLERQREREGGLESELTKLKQVSYP